jgi:hypothetical protein
VCLCVCLNACPGFCLSWGVRVSVCVCVLVCLCACVSLWVGDCVCVCLSVCVCVCLCLSVCVPVCPDPTWGDAPSQRCLKDLKERFARISIDCSPPLVPFRETLAPNAAAPIPDPAAPPAPPFSSTSSPMRGPLSAPPAHAPTTLRRPHGQRTVSATGPLGPPLCAPLQKHPRPPTHPHTHTFTNTHTHTRSHTHTHFLSLMHAAILVCRHRHCWPAWPDGACADIQSKGRCRPYVHAHAAHPWRTDCTQARMHTQAHTYVCVASVMDGMGPFVFLSFLVMWGVCVKWL